MSKRMEKRNTKMGKKVTHVSTRQTCLVSTPDYFPITTGQATYHLGLDINFRLTKCRNTLTIVITTWHQGHESYLASFQSFLRKPSLKQVFLFNNNMHQHLFLLQIIFYSQVMLAFKHELCCVWLIFALSYIWLYY